MQLTHIALWTNHLERLRDFYVKYFNGIRKVDQSSDPKEWVVKSRKEFKMFFSIPIF